MKTKIVIWGTNEQEERLLIALALRAKENKVDIYTFPAEVATDEFAKKMMDEWRDDKEIPFPDPHTHLEKDLSVTEDLLPENLRVERGDVIQRAKTEWQFVVLSSKLHQVYEQELNELKGRIEKLEKFEHNVWDDLKEFWGKVQQQVTEENLFRDHADSLRDNTNELFAQLKELRAKMDEEFAARSKEFAGNIQERLEELEGKISEGLRLQQVFEDLKKLQRNFRDTKLTREDRSKLWQRIDAAFKAVKEKRFGPGANTDSSPMQRLKRRYDGLLNAIKKMERSIKRDRDDLSFQERKIQRTDGQLEAQIRQAKIKMIEERINSKEHKLAEMMKTKGELEGRMESLNEKEKKRAEQEKVKEAKEAAKEKIAEQIKQQSEDLKKEEDKLEKAAASISDKKTPEEEKQEEKESEKTQEEEESVLSAASEALGESLEDMIDTVKAVAEVVGDKMEEKIEEIKEKLKDQMAEEE